MYEVVSNLLWIGNAGDARTPTTLFDVGIAAIVDVAYEEPIAQLPREIVYCRFPLVDGGGNAPRRLQLAVETLVNFLRADIPTLVSCSAGMSRSPAIAAAALSIYRSEPPAQSLESLVRANPHDVSTTLWDDVLKACGLV